jgi:hypothetical protein
MSNNHMAECKEVAVTDFKILERFCTKRKAANTFETDGLATEIRTRDVHSSKAGWRPPRTQCSAVGASDWAWHAACTQRTHLTPSRPCRALSENILLVQGTSRTAARPKPFYSATAHDVPTNKNSPLALSKINTAGSYKL